MSFSEYLSRMEKMGFSRDVVSKALWNHACYIERNGLPAGIHNDQTETDSYEARMYGMECKRMIQEEANKQVISGWLDGEFIRQCVDELREEGEID
jgi:hypothetical protein